MPIVQEELGDVVYVELPEVGSEVTAGETFGVVESVKVSAWRPPAMAGWGGVACWRCLAVGVKPGLGPCCTVFALGAEAALCPPPVTSLLESRGTIFLCVCRTCPKPTTMLPVARLPATCTPQ